MGYSDLEGLINALEGQGELLRIHASVDPCLEVACIVDRVVKGKGGGKALLFSSLVGSSYPLVTNLFGDPVRCATALGLRHLDELTERVEAVLGNDGQEDPITQFSRVLSDTQYGSRLVTCGPCQEVVDDLPDLSTLPTMKSWPGDGGRFLTLPLVFTRHPETGVVNCGMYRMQIFNGRTASIRFGTHSDGGRHFAAWKRLGKPMPVAVALGGPPALIFAATTPLPADIDERSLSTFISGVPVESVPCLSCDLEVPATAEFILEGYLAPDEMREEGPFGNHTGYYHPASPAPVFHLTALTHRKRAIYPATVVGPPPRENLWLAKASERLFLPLLRRLVPEVVDINFMVEGIFHGCAVLSVRESDGRPGREILKVLWETFLLRSSRLLVLLDEDVDLRNGSQVLWTLINRADPTTGVFVEDGRMGIVAMDSRQWQRVAPEPSVADLVTKRWAEYGLE